MEIYLCSTNKKKFFKNARHHRFSGQYINQWYLLIKTPYGNETQHTYIIF